MKKFISVFLYSSVLLPVVYAFLVLPAYADNGVRLACSSQIAKAYGKGILKDFRKFIGVYVQVYNGPSHKALDRLVNDVSDIALTALRVPDEMKKKGYIEIPFCQDSIAIFTNVDSGPGMTCPLSNLTINQVRGIFSGRISNWKELGGADRKIEVIVPGEQTGAYQNFRMKVMQMEEIKYDVIFERSVAVIGEVQGKPGSISFMTNGALAGEESIKILTVDKVSPKDKRYPFKQIFSFAIKKYPAPFTATKAMINFGLSHHGLQIMYEKGLVPV
ncbi:MAG: substrate-binding domain-containing protein, partial [Deltaproteobacteria bacterium]|nr:substrate-binding domain-containing protein [Deltaproteobacteria bacterium]